MTIRDELKAALVQLDQNPYSLEYSFEKLALEVFRFQFAQNPVYNKYVKFLYKDIKKIDRLERIPFLPIEFFYGFRCARANSCRQNCFGFYADAQW